MIKERKWVERERDRKLRARLGEHGER